MLRHVRCVDCALVDTRHRSPYSIAPGLKMTDSHSDSSVEIISSISCCATEASEDVVVWGVSDEYSSESSVTDSDMDYVLLPRTSAEGSPNSDSGDSAPEDMLSIPFNLLSVNKVQYESDTNQVHKPNQNVEQILNSDTHEARTPNGSYDDAAAYITQCVFADTY